MRPSKPGFWKGRIDSFACAFAGIFALVLRERNAWLHLVATLGVIAAGILFHVERWEWVALIFSLGMVWTAEALNTALEELTDLVSPEQNPKAGRAKDLAAGGVLFAAMAAAGVGVVVFGPRLIALLK